MRLYRIIDAFGRRRKVYYRQLGERHYSTWTDRRTAATIFGYEHVVNTLADEIHRRTGQIVYVEQA